MGNKSKDPVNMRVDTLGIGGINNSLEYNLVIHQINKKTNTLFNGTGLNDLYIGSTYTGTESTFFNIVISANNPDKYKWRKKTTGDYGEYSAEIPLAANTPQEIEKGFYINFASDKGHTIDDEWIVTFTLIGGIQILNPEGTVIFAITGDNSSGTATGWGT